jgi:uncharacterized protein with GYD domain
VKTLLEHPQAREDVIGKACASMGGKMHAFFFCFGEYDVAMIAEFPDNVTAAGFALDSVAGGAVSRYLTTVLLTSAEGVAAMKKAKLDSYVPPR